MTFFESLLRRAAHFLDDVVDLQVRTFSQFPGVLHFLHVRFPLVETVQKSD